MVGRQQKTVVFFVQGDGCSSRENSVCVFLLTILNPVSGYVSQLGQTNANQSGLGGPAAPAGNFLLSVFFCGRLTVVARSCTEAETNRA